MLIKKYSNRRLYDTKESRYITHEELADKIKKGASPKVVDAKTGEDLTQSTLAHIILESRKAGRLLPIPLLLQMIRMDDSMLTEFMGTTLSWALQVFTQARQSVRSLAALSPFQLMQMNLSGYGQPQQPPQYWGHPQPQAPMYPAYPPQAPPYVQPPPGYRPPSEDEPFDEEEPPESDVDTLRREVEALKEALVDAVKLIKDKSK